MSNTQTITWQPAQVKSPHLNASVPVIVARDVPYVPNAHHFQNLNIYLLETPETSKFISQPVTSLPTLNQETNLPQGHVHIHGGAWRDPQLTSPSIEAAVAYAFAPANATHPITAIISLNYTLSQFPTHPTLPYDAIKDSHNDPSREAIHPMHIRDILSGLALLKNLGVTDNSYILTGHSAGSCLAFQSILQSPAHWNSDDTNSSLRPAALVGLNGLCDLPGLVYNLGESHAHLQAVYSNLIGIAFGTDERGWPAASPALFDSGTISKRAQEGNLPKLVVVDQSTEDQLVPVNQIEKMYALLNGVPGLRVVRGHRCVDRHAAPWEEGYTIWESVQDVLNLLS